MIGYLKGQIIDKNEKNIIILVNGVGYLVYANSDLVANTQLKQEIELFIHTVVREDDIALYGFLKRDELVFFNQLTSVSGIGPKMGLEILSVPVNMTQNAILNGDTGILTKIKGLGKKTAERLILELKNKITPASITNVGDSPTPMNEDAILALESLGYERFQVVKAMANLPKEITDTEEIVKYFLKSAI